MGRRLEKFDVVDKINQRIAEWGRMAAGTLYNCGYDDQGMNLDFVSRATMDELEQEWVRRSAGARQFVTEWSISVLGGTDFVIRDGTAKFCFRLPASG